MNELFKHKEAIVEELSLLESEFLSEYGDLPWGKESISKIFNSAKKGKLLRGALVLFSASEYGYPLDSQSYRLAALMELAHTGLLIHDDIMDEDEVRRGEKSIYVQLSEDAKIIDSKNYRKSGESLGICAGDILFFMVFQSLARLSVKHSLEIVQVFSRELILCGYGQMQDIVLEINSYEDIISLYMLKTGRYSFSLPLMLGAILAGAKKEELDLMILFGRKIGPLFQIADDRLGIEGTEEEIGKPVGSDIKEGKNTLYWYLLMQKVSGINKDRLSQVKNSTPSSEDIELIKKLLEEYGINSELNSIEDTLSKDVSDLISQIDMSQSGKIILNQLVDFVKRRKN